MSTTERRRRSVDPLDYLEKDPNLHYIRVSKQTGENHEYKGFASQADYFSMARGFTVATDVDRKILPNSNMVIMTIPKSEKEAWDNEGTEDTNAVLDGDAVTMDNDISGGDPEIKITENTLKVTPVTRRRTAKRKAVKR